jgi:glycosyltransferase involved in cell wall biosynthesis
MISIIIPAYNEENVIAVTLKELFAGAACGELEVIIVCNGCTDNTARVASSFGSSVKIIETSVPSKANALNLGDASAVGFPRIYQDADVVLNIDAIRKIGSVLKQGDFLAAAPTMLMDFEFASSIVRSYYEVWQRLPYIREGFIGTGVYALSEEGRRRFDVFPSIIADDGYIRALFKPHERTAVTSCYSRVRAPADLIGLLKIKTRSRLGGYELQQKFGALVQSEEKNYGSALCELVSLVHLWPKVPIYLFVNLFARYKARKQAKTLGFSGWERDESSRGRMKKHE